MLRFFYDTETTGLPLFKEPSDDPRQPHIVQFCGQLVDDDGDRVIAGFDLIVRPDGWVIPPECSALHGITTEHALAVGVPEDFVLILALDLWRRSESRVAHNEQFDARMVRIAAKRFAGEQRAEAWKAGPAECTARMATPVCKLPPTSRMQSAGFTNYKTPKLSEAHELLIGRPLEGAHSALADTEGCRRLYRYLQTLRGDGAAQ